MASFETSATVEDEGRVLVNGVPFAPGSEVEVTISLKDPSSSIPDDLAASRERMRELFQSIKGFRNAPRIPREELYDRGRVR